MHLNDASQPPWFFYLLIIIMFFSRPDPQKTSPYRRAQAGAGSLTVISSPVKG